MVSYYNSLPYSQKHSANLAYPPAQAWFPSNYPAPPNQFLSGMESSHHHQHMYYNPHMFHQSGGTEWHPAHDNFQQQHQLIEQNAVNSQLNESSSRDTLTEAVHPSPPITVSATGSELSSPGVPPESSSPHASNSATIHNNNNRPVPVKSEYYEWMKKPAYPTQPTPGKTRTKDKYRVVYTDFQRLELEKEYHTSRYITIRRKTELAQTLQLSERQVKIWFQNRRAKERKQNKKRDETLAVSHGSDFAALMETKPKIEPGLHLQHPLHQMSSMAMGMPPMGLPNGPNLYHF